MYRDILKEEIQCQYCIEFYLKKDDALVSIKKDNINNFLEASVIV